MHPYPHACRVVCYLITILGIVALLLTPDPDVRVVGAGLVLLVAAVWWCAWQHARDVAERQCNATREALLLDILNCADPDRSRPDSH